MATFKVIRPQIVVRDEKGQQHMLLQDAVFSDEGLDADHVEMLEDEDFIEPFEAPEPHENEGDPEGDQPTTVAGIVDLVGDDKDLAQQYLDEENAADKPRTTLVEKLQAVLDAD